MAFKCWKRTSNDRYGETYESNELRTIVDITTPYRFGKNSFVGITISGKGTKIFPKGYKNKLSVMAATKFAKAYMKKHNRC